MAALRLFYDVSFFIIVTTIGLNIVFGIIVDTFSELRDERVCLLCVCVHNTMFIIMIIVVHLSVTGGQWNFERQEVATLAIVCLKLELGRRCECTRYRHEQ